MAPQLTRPEIFIIFTILIFNYDGVCGNAGGILSRLYQQASQENRPLILVLDNSNNENLDELPKIQESSDVNHHVHDPLSELYEMLKVNEKKPAFELLESKPTVYTDKSDRDRRRPRNRDRKQRFPKWGNKDRVADRYDQNQYRDEQDNLEKIRDNINDNQDRHNRVHENAVSNKKSFLRSPLFRSFLRYSASLRCAAKDECEEECSDNFVGTKKDKCEDKCEVKFECPETEEDPCERGECEESNECGQDGCNVSTRGVTLVTETPKCKRC